MIVTIDLATVERIKYAVMAVYERYGVLTDQVMQAQIIGAIAETLKAYAEEISEEKLYPHSKVEMLLNLLDEEYEKTHGVWKQARDDYNNGAASALDLAERLVMKVFEIPEDKPLHEKEIFTGNNPDLWQ